MATLRVFKIQARKWIVVSGSEARDIRSYHSFYLLSNISFPSSNFKLGMNSITSQDTSRSSKPSSKP